MLTTAAREMNTWKSSYGNKTSLQALFNFHQVTEMSHLNRILALFSASLHFANIIELKSLVTLTTVIKLLKVDLDSLCCAPRELLLQAGNEARCICLVNFTSNLNSECLNKDEIFLDW